MMPATSNLRSMPRIKGKWATGLIRCTVIAMIDALCLFSTGLVTQPESRGDSLSSGLTKNHLHSQCPLNMGFT